MKILNSSYISIIVLFILLYLWLVIKKDNYYFQFVKKYWFYKKSKTKKMATRAYLIGSIILFVSLLDFRYGDQKKENSGSNKTIILIDNSLSMRANDLKPNRIVKALEFASIYLRKENEMFYSLMTFSDFSKVLVPFTLDKEIIRTNLDILKEINIFRGGSNLFSSIDKSIDYLKKNSLSSSPKGNILILSDGDVHDFYDKFTIPNGIKVASINFSSKLGGAVPSFDLDGNYKEPLYFKGKRVHSIAKRKIFKNLENDYVNFKHWAWKPGVSIEENIYKFFQSGDLVNEKKKGKGINFITLWVASVGILFLSFSFIISRFKSFNKSVAMILVTCCSGFYSLDTKANMNLENFLFLKIKNGSSSRIERLKLAEIYFKKDNFGMSKNLYEENLIGDYNKEDLGNLFNYGTLLLKMGLLKNGVNVFDKIKLSYRNKKKFKELENKINNNILISLSKQKKLKSKKLIINPEKEIKNKNAFKKRKKFINEITQSAKNKSILKDQLVNHVLSQDRAVQKTKILLNIYKNKADWKYKGW